MLEDVMFRNIQWLHY